MFYLTFQRFIVFLIAISILIVISFIFFDETDDTSYSCQYYYNLKENNFNGIVEAKFISTYDHSLRKIVVNSETITLTFKLRNVYRLIAVGDSVSLDKEEDVLKIYKNNKISNQISIADLCPIN